MPSMKKVPVQNAPGILQFKYEITIQLKTLYLENEYSILNANILFVIDT